MLINTLMKRTQHNFRHRTAQTASTDYRRLLTWLFCLVLVVSVVPALPAMCAIPADCGTASGQPCCGCCATSTGSVMSCSTPTESGARLQSVRCEAAVPAARSEAVGIRESRGGQLLAADTAEAVLTVSLAVTPEPGITDRQTRSSSSGPPDHFALTPPGRAPPVAADNS